jgi:hypothetical protein
MSHDDGYQRSVLGTSGIYVNPHGDGRAWERPASLELINPDGSQGFQINAGIRVAVDSAATVNNPKHAFRFFFRDDYGASKLKYPLFGDDPTATDTFDKIDLRTFQNYSWSYQGDASGTFVRDIIGRDLQLGGMGDEQPRQGLQPLHQRPVLGHLSDR